MTSHLDQLLYLWGDCLLIWFFICLAFHLCRPIYSPILSQMYNNSNSVSSVTVNILSFSLSEELLAELSPAPRAVSAAALYGAVVLGSPVSALGSLLLESPVLLFPGFLRQS